jgi:glycosyltransferase involved in cell wall biosynthesis
MKIALYTIAFAPSTGGVERFGDTLARWLVANGHDVVVATATPGVGGDDFPILRSTSPGRTVRAMRAADVVHVSGLSARGIGLALAAGRRPVVTHHGYQAVCPTGLAWSPTGVCTAGPDPGPCPACPGRGLRGAVDTRAHRIAGAWGRASVFVSRAVRERLGLQGRVIKNPVSVPGSGVQGSEPGLGSDLVFAGRLVREKGLDLLLRALRSVPDARLRVAGDGPMRGSWERLAEDLGVARRTSFLGGCSADEVADLYATSALVCVPSLWAEPFGYAAAEAMALGRAVVGSPIGALPELLEDGRGFLAEAVTPDALAAAIRDALRDPEGRRRAGKAALSFAERELAPDRVGAKYLRIYEAALR